MFLRDPHATTVDWQFDRVLAQYGLASLALTPAKATMIGQEMSLEEQGLVLATGPVSVRLNDPAFKQFRALQTDVRSGNFRLPPNLFLVQDDGSSMIMPHQFLAVGGWFEGEWALKWSQAFGPFTYRGRVESKAFVRLSGPVSFLVSGGKSGGEVRVQDYSSNFDVTVRVDPEGPNGQVMQLPVPAGVSYRALSVIVVSGEIWLYGVAAREQQPLYFPISFTHAHLPPVDFPAPVDTLHSDANPALVDP